MDMTQTPTTDRCEKCARCLFAIAEFIPDPSAPYQSGKQKPRVSGFRCHINRPSTSGFPVVRGDEFCAFFTDAKTRKQPLFRFAFPAAPITTALPFNTRTGTGEA